MWTDDLENVSHFLKNFKKPLEFDEYFTILGQLQNHAIESNIVQENIKKYICYLDEYYNYTLTREAFRILANSYQNNELARQYLLKYGTNFNEFISKGMNYYLDQHT